MNLEIIKDVNNLECRYYFDDFIFTMSYLGNLDLYWNVIPKKLNEDKISFVVTYENQELYSLINEVYESISNNTINGLSEYTNEKLQKRQYSNNINLFNDSTITWHSDDEPFEESNLVKIKKNNNKYFICFDKSNSGKMNFSVRFVNSGSRYAPFNIVFMQMFKKIIGSKEQHMTK